MTETNPSDDGGGPPSRTHLINYIVLAFALVFVVLPRLSPFHGLNDAINDMNVFRRASEWTIERTESLFSKYGYYVVFLGVLAENSAFLGLLVPGAIILILGGLAAENGSINIWYVFGLGICATIIGDTISYVIGRMGWARFLERGAFGRMLDRVREPVHSNSTWIILAYHFAGYSRVVGPMAAGMFRIPYRKWAPLDYAGGSLWVVAFTMLGVVLGLFGVEFGDTKRMVQLLEFALLAVLVGAVVVTFARVMRDAPPGSPPSTPSGRRGRASTVTIAVDPD